MIIILPILYLIYRPLKLTLDESAGYKHRNELGGEGYLLKREISRIKYYLTCLTFIGTNLLFFTLLIIVLERSSPNFSPIYTDIYLSIITPIILFFPKREMSRIKYYLTDLTFIGISPLLSVYSYGFSTFLTLALAIFLAIFPIFYVAYRLLKLTLDESARYKQGTKLSFMGVDSIFPYYPLKLSPLKLGENDHVTFPLVWTVISFFVAAFPWIVLTFLFNVFFYIFWVSVLGIMFGINLYAPTLGIMFGINLHDPAFGIMFGINLYHPANIAYILNMFLFVPTFFVVYKILKLILDESARYKMGTDLGFSGVELIFSRYPLKVGENDRVTFRRRLKNNYWTKLFKINNFPVNSHITVNLVCVERTTNINTMRKDDVVVVYEKMIYSDNLFCGDREVIAHFDLEIPLSCRSSFEGKHSQIRWILDMEESYPGLLE